MQFGAVHFLNLLNVLIITLLCVQIYLVQLRKLSCHLFGKELLARLVNYNFLFVCYDMLSIFPFDVWDKLWVLILSVPEVSLLIQFIYNADRFPLKHGTILYFSR